MGRWRRRLGWSALAFSVTLMCAGATGAGLVWGRPHVLSQLRRTDNLLILKLAPGRGPLAGWLLSHSTISAGGRRGRRLALHLPAGRTSHVPVHVTSLWSSSIRLRIRVPPKPALLGSTTTAQSVTLRFSMPVTVRDVPCRLSFPRSLVTSVTFPRQSTPCTGTLRLVAASGEEAGVPFAVPALFPPPPPASATPAPVIYFGPSAGGSFYITIDDGIYPDPQVLTLMQQSHVPITAFLVSSVAASHLDYWRAFLAAGGDIEDHTVTHPDLTRISPSAAQSQWSDNIEQFHRWFGITPSLGRPPYGHVNPAVQVAAAQAGLHDIVMWSASMYNGQLTTYDNTPLRAGEIVLLHWLPGLYNNLVKLLSIASARGLHPAPLAASLAPGG